MTKKTKKEKSSLNKVLDAVDTSTSIVSNYLDQRYKFEKKVDDIKEKAESKAEELKEDAIHSAYEVKKGFTRALIELVLLSSGIIALILGGLGYARKFASTETILIGYGLIITIIVLLQMKLE